MSRNDPARNDHLPHRMQRRSTRLHVLGLARRNAGRRSPKVEWRRSEGGTATVGRWNPPKDFGHLIGDLLDMSTSAPRGARNLQARLGPNSGPFLRWPSCARGVDSRRRPTVTGLMARTAATTRSLSRGPSLVGVRADLRVPSQRPAGVWAREAARGGTSLGDASLSANSEGGQTSDGRRERPTNFAPLDVDCVS